MSADLRTRRVANEFDLLKKLEEANPGVLAVLGRSSGPDGDRVAVAIHQTEGLVQGGDGLAACDSHEAEFQFPELFPAVPIEAFLKRPVFHPNVHPENGFVCLWSRFSAGDTIIEAVRQLQRVIRWEVFNSETDHLMQPEALAAAANLARPLAGTAIRVPVDLASERGWRARTASGRRRLTTPAG